MTVPQNIFGRAILTGGAFGSVDAIDGNRLNDGDIVLAMPSTGILYPYRVNSTSGAAESSPDIIAPDTNPGNKRHILAEIIAKTLTARLGNITLVNGNLVIGTSGKGIDFSASGNAAAMAGELFDDYEHGDWTIGISFGGGTTDIVYQTGYTTGKYVKKGNEVSISGIVYTSLNGSSSGALKITGLPFTNGSGYKFASAISLVSAALNYTGQIVGSIDSGETSIAMYNVIEAGTLTALTESNWPDACWVQFAATYFTA